MNQEDVKKSIFDFVDYRELLKFLFARCKLTNKAFSYRYFSKRAGFASSNFLLKVMTGQSRLSEKSIKKFVKGFDLNADEAHFFRHLVLFNQATTVDQKQIHAQEIMRNQGYRKIYPLAEAQYHFFSNWYFVPIRELVNFPGFKEDPKWVAAMVVPPVTPEQAQGALETLQQLGMLTRNAEGQLVQSHKHLATADEVVSSSLAQCHRDMMKRASESIDTIAREARDISFVTVGTSHSNVKKIKELIHKFRVEVVELAQKDPSCEAVYQLNLQLFPIAGEFVKKK
ncbi:MAG: TIGR02147 family protein [Pseudobdellovibrionaceae bacterium]